MCKGGVFVISFVAIICSSLFECFIFDKLGLLLSFMLENFVFIPFVLYEAGNFGILLVVKIILGLSGQNLIL